MTVWPKTEARAASMWACLEALQSLVTCSDEYDIRWHISSETEGVEDAIRSQMVDWCHEHGARYMEHPEPPDLGGNLTGLLTECEGDFLFLVQDDRLLQRRCDLTLGLRLLEEHPGISSISYAMTPDGQEHVSYFGRIHEFGAVSANTPRRYINPQSLVMRQSFVDRFGVFAPNDPHGAAELDMHKKMRTARVMSLIAIHPYFSHVDCPSVAQEESR